MEEKTEVKIKSLQKALSVLDCFAEKPLLGVTEISEKLGLYKSNVHNILLTLKAMHYLEQDEESGKYRLSVAVFNLSRALTTTFAISKISLPYMQELADRVNERVFLAVPAGDEVLYLDSTYPKESFSLMRIITGDRAKMYCTGVGRAMMAYLPEKVIDEYLSHPLKKYTDYTITDPAVLRTELARTRTRGYSIDNMEHEFGVRCIGMPIFNKYKKLEGGISISGPAEHLSTEKLEEYAIILKNYITKIEERI
ncbi:MAG: IclR family transcriptional regulator [Eubacteriales bacterium]|nr:IclR family transcriptional regulator [Eubacteriales bacterium]